ncbi:MFS transporter [Devosia pacifica]|uniref:MFS transporter n=1 Tax=Devosia pacifica TaxID=1335967 RepID=A0A918SE31_9HYPH|nr:MFS transporter [Devosia pacifica]GHA35655.1 MFS transporter [Devosia pacifica]
MFATLTTGSDRYAARPAILVVLGFASVIGALMQTMVLPLLPQFPALFGVSVTAASWIATSTMLVGAIGAPLLGWLGDRFGLKPVIILALALLGVGSLISGLAGELGMMIVGRVLQGFSVGIVGLSMAMLRRLWDFEGLPMAVGIISGTIGIGTSLGVPLAGLIVEFGSWRTIFWIMAVCAALAAILILAVVPNVQPVARRRFDLAGALGLGVILTLLLLPISVLADGQLSMGSATMWLLLAVGLTAIWLRHQWRAPDAFVDLRLFARPAISSSHLIALLLGFAFFLSFTGTITVVQMPAGAVGLGGSVLLTGLVQTPASLSAIFAPPLAGLMVVRFGARAAIITGIAVSLVAFGLRAVDLGHPVPIAASAMLVSGGISFAFAALPVALMGATPADRLGASNGFNMLSRQMGAAIASVTGAAVVATSIDFINPAGPQAFYWLFSLGAASSFTALLLALCTKTLTTSPSMIRGHAK